MAPPIILSFFSLSFSPPALSSPTSRPHGPLTRCDAIRSPTAAGLELVRSVEAWSGARGRPQLLARPWRQGSSRSSRRRGSGSNSTVRWRGSLVGSAARQGKAMGPSEVAARPMSETAPRPPASLGKNWRECSVLQPLQPRVRRGRGRRHSHLLLWLGAPPGAQLTTPPHSLAPAASCSPA